MARKNRWIFYLFFGQMEHPKKAKSSALTRPELKSKHTHTRWIPHFFSYVFCLTAWYTASVDVSRQKALLHRGTFDKISDSL